MAGKSIKLRLSLLLALCTFAYFLQFCSEKTQSQADLVLMSGVIYTVDDSLPQTEALAVRDGRIVAVGPDKEISRYVGDETYVMELDGRTVLPGLIEGHAHFAGIGKAKQRLALAEAETFDDIVQMVAERVKQVEPGEWILGRGWHQEKWTETPSPNVDGLPLNDELSRVSPDNPVMLTHASGHSAIVNEYVFNLVGIDENSPDPEGGAIIRDSNGRPIGTLLENGMDTVDQALKEYLDQRTDQEIERDRREIIALAQKECNSKGITSFHDAGAKVEWIDLYREMAKAGELDVRLWVMMSDSNEVLVDLLPRYRMIGEGNDFLTVRAIKRVLDGALGSHGAWLLQPYEDLNSSSGLNTIPLDEFAQTASLAAQYDFQLCTHAIGDRANREALNIYEAAFGDNPNREDFRWRIEHAQHLHPEDIVRFGRLGVIAAMQGVHCTSDGPWVPKRIGNRRAAEGAYAWRKLINAGVVIANGTDAPVEDVNPIASFYSSVTRQLPDGSAFYGDQCMTRQEALRSYTINAAYAAFEEDLKGSLTVGKLADMVILSQDIMTVPVEDIPDTEILSTIVAGKIVYSQ